jgi:hypothetical protein
VEGPRTALGHHEPPTNRRRTAARSGINRCFQARLWFGTSTWYINKEICGHSARDLSWMDDPGRFCNAVWLSSGQLGQWMNI